MNTLLLKRLKNRQDSIVFESEEDEGAAEFYGELQSIIDVIEAGKPEAEVKAACEHVGVVYEQSSRQEYVAFTGQCVRGGK